MIPLLSRKPWNSLCVSLCRVCTVRASPLNPPISSALSMLCFPTSCARSWPLAFCTALVATAALGLPLSTLKEPSEAYIVLLLPLRRVGTLGRSVVSVKSYSVCLSPRAQSASSCSRASAVLEVKLRFYVSLHSAQYLYLPFPCFSPLCPHWPTIHCLWLLFQLPMVIYKLGYPCPLLPCCTLQRNDL